MALTALVHAHRFSAACRMATVRPHRRRSISASICLLMVVLLYAPLAGAAWWAHRSACCTSGQCASHGHHQQKAPSAPANDRDCEHGMSDRLTCAMSCCHDSDRSLLTPIAFVLPPSVAIAPAPAIQSPIEFAIPLDFPRSIEPLSPPPRSVSAASLRFSLTFADKPEPRLARCSTNPFQENEST